MSMQHYCRRTERRDDACYRIHNPPGARKLVLWTHTMRPLGGATLQQDMHKQDAKIGLAKQPRRLCCMSTVDQCTGMLF